VEGDRRELAILRLTSEADMTPQSFDGKSMLGFSVFQVSRRSDARKYEAAQINSVTYYLDDDGSFSQVKTVPLDRTRRFGRNDADNPVHQLFED
jgi:hypothetical protein